jgi:hypothetical protein
VDEADLKIGLFTLTVHGRQFPSSTDFWDGNWLNVTARAIGDGARVEVNGSIVRSDELERFRDELSALLEKLEGGAELKCIEPNLSLKLRLDGLGHVHLELVLTPDHLNQSHTFQFELDQTYLEPARAACSSILRRYPVIGR